MVAKNIPCRYLVFSPNGIANCTIYQRKTRLNTQLVYEKECGELQDACFIPLDCAYRSFFPLKPTEPE
jgi:uncharacterized cysteine cluster protein YcgN (CxxCxxCC family)